MARELYRLGMSFETLAERSGLEAVRIEDIVTFHSRYTITEAIVIARALNVNAAKLVYDL